MAFSSWDLLDHPSPAEWNIGPALSCDPEELVDALQTFTRACTLTRLHTRNGRLYLTADVLAAEFPGNVLQTSLTADIERSGAIQLDGRGRLALEKALQELPADSSRITLVSDTETLLIQPPPPLGIDGAWAVPLASDEELQRFHELLTERMDALSAEADAEAEVEAEDEPEHEQAYDIIDGFDRPFLTATERRRRRRGRLRLPSRPSVPRFEALRQREPSFASETEAAAEPEPALESADEAGLRFGLSLVRDYPLSSDPRDERSPRDAA